MFNLDGFKIINEPFPHIKVDNLFEPHEFAKLEQEFPDKKYFLKLQEGQEGRRILGRWSKYLYEFLDSSPSWKNLYNYVVAERFIKDNFYLFEKELTACNIKFQSTKLSPHVFGFESRLKRIQEKFATLLGINKIRHHLSGDEFCISFSINRANHGYTVAPHHDCRNKLLVFLIFFNDDLQIGGTGGEFVMHSYTSDTNQYPMYPNTNQINHFQTVKPKKNTAVIFLNTANAYHSVNKLIHPNDDRKFLYFSIAHRWKKDSWI